MAFANQVVWITGASSGIGEALAYAFSQAGATLVLSARRKSALEEVRARCANADRHLIVPLDLADFDAVAVTQTVIAQMGQVDILVNSGGVSQRGSVAETTLAVDRQIMEINFFGTIALSKALLPAMLARKQGQLVVISSVQGKVSKARRSAYSASKHALHGYFDALRAEVAATGITVTLVCPGYVQTNLSYRALGSSGESHDQLDPGQARGISAAACAAAILRAVKQKKAEVYIGGWETWAVTLNRLFPNLVRWGQQRIKST